MGEGKWLRRGKQRKAVAVVLATPMTTKQIWEAAKPFSPHLQARDVSTQLGRFVKRGLAECLTPRRITDRLYFWTDRGRRIASQAFGKRIQPAPDGVNWAKYAEVMFARTRLRVFRSMDKRAPAQSPGWTASMLKKELSNIKGIHLNAVSRALKELLALRLIRCVGVTRKSSLKLYAITPSGRKLLDNLAIQFSGIMA